MAVSRERFENCDRPENGFVFESMSDYLTMIALVTRSVSRGLSSSCALTALQYRILVDIALRPRALAKDVAKRLCVGTSTVSAAIAGLAERGLVARCESATDMRAIELSLTDAGRALASKANEAVLGVARDYWSSLSRPQLDAVMGGAAMVVERHSDPEREGGARRLDVTFVNGVLITRDFVERALRGKGFATRDYRILLALRITGCAISSAEVARFLFLNPSDVTSCLKNLEATGCITRERLAGNRRVRGVSLTDVGAKRVVELTPLAFDALIEAGEVDGAQLQLLNDAAQDLVARKRSHSEFR